MRTLLLLVLCAASFTAASLHGQASPYEIKRRNDCRLAEQVLRAGHPAPHLRWAGGLARYCPSSGAAVAEAMNRNRTSADTALLNAITLPMMNLRDGRVYDMALDVARDKTASVPARMFAIRALVWALEPGGVIEYADLADEWPEGRQRICTRGTPLHLILTRGEPVSANLGEVINKFGEQTESDASEPRPIRRAAFCARISAVDLTDR